MKKVYLSEKVLDLNDLEIRYIGEDNEIHAKTYASLLSEPFKRVNVPISQKDVVKRYESVIEKIEAALTAAVDAVTELTDEEFKLIDNKAKQVFDSITLWRWNKMVATANPVEEETESK